MVFSPSSVKQIALFSLDKLFIILVQKKATFVSVFIANNNNQIAHNILVHFYLNMNEFLARFQSLYCHLRTFTKFLLV